MSGIGFWTHSTGEADIWQAGKSINDEYALVYPGANAVPSVRWEAVIETTNGREGLVLYRQQPADLVITDIKMPELNGLDLILELTREFLNVKVIAISGVQGEATGSLAAAKLLGARQTLRKPFSLQTVLAAVEYELAH